MYQLQLTNEQTSIVSAALDLYARIGIGQFEVIVDSLKRHDPKLFGTNTTNAEQSIQQAKYDLYKLTPNSSFGIYNENVPNVFRAAWDIKKVIQHQLWQDGDKNYMSVHSRIPDSSSGLPLPVIQKKERIND